MNVKVKVDGFEIELFENKFKDIVFGVILDFKIVVLGCEICLNVKENMEVISGKIKFFVDVYNVVLGWI